MYCVSVSLRSIIHSYTYELEKNNKTLKGFRLLTEYYSFLCYHCKCQETSMRPSFRLLTEYYSFFLYLDISYNFRSLGLFPSPYGVLFILIGEWISSDVDEYERFPSPYGVLFILINQIW